MPGLSTSELRQLYELYAPVVYRRALAIVGREADAWDVVQEVFQRMIEVGGSFRGEARPMTYIYRATTNHALNLLRARRVREPASEPTPELEPSLAPDALEARNLVQALVQELDERALCIATLHFLDGLTQEQIAEVVGLSRKTVGRELGAIREKAASLAGIEEAGHG